MKEEWKEIEGYHDYEVSNHGRVKSLKFNKERILKNNIISSGYYLVCLYDNNKVKSFLVHSLVAIHFLNHKPNGHKIVVDHIDNDKSNNNVSNLQLISNRENSSKDKKGGTSKYVGVSWINGYNRWRSQIRINGKLKYLGYFDDEYEGHLAYQKALKKLNNLIISDYN